MTVWGFGDSFLSGPVSREGVGKDYRGHVGRRQNESLGMAGKKWLLAKKKSSLTGPKGSLLAQENPCSGGSHKLFGRGAHITDEDLNQNWCLKQNLWFFTPENASPPKKKCEVRVESYQTSKNLVLSLGVHNNGLKDHYQRPRLPATIMGPAWQAHGTGPVRGHLPTIHGRHGGPHRRLGGVAARGRFSGQHRQSDPTPNPH